jgi:hypothetical protein
MDDKVVNLNDYNGKVLIRLKDDFFKLRMNEMINNLSMEQLDKLRNMVNEHYRNNYEIVTITNGELHKMILNTEYGKMNGNNDIEKMYKVKWKLKDENGLEWIEEHEHMLLHDFEVLYGDNIHDIVWMQLRKHGQAMI